MFSIYADKGDRRRRVKWLSANRFEQVRLALLLPLGSRHYKVLLTKENLQSVYQHLGKFSHSALLQIANCNFDCKVHKVYKRLDSALGGTEEVQGSRAVGVSSPQETYYGDQVGKREKGGKAATNGRKDEEETRPKAGCFRV